MPHRHREMRAQSLWIMITNKFRYIIDDSTSIFCRPSNFKVSSKGLHRRAAAIILRLIIRDQEGNESKCICHTYLVHNFHLPTQSQTTNSGEATYSPLATLGYHTIPIGWLITTCDAKTIFTWCIIFMPQKIQLRIQDQ